MANNFNQVEQSALKALDSIIAKTKELDLELSKINSTLANMSKLGNVSDAGDTIKKYESEINKLNQTISKLESETTKLNAVKRVSNQRTSEEVVNQRALRKQADLNATANSKLVGAYQRLNAQRALAKKRLQDLIASGKDSTAQIKKAQNEYNELTSRINKANKATSNFNKTGLGVAIRGFRNLIGAFGVAGGVYLFADLVKNVIETTKTFQALNFALETVTTTTKEFAESKSFLRDITNRYGLDLEKTTERFAKFLAAAKNSNVSMKDTKQIFESTSKAAAVLGLRTHELEGVYLALEQMLSKGKVSTEELRRQLGERLPAAFGIMAQSLGVSVSELDKMLKNGEVLSSDALPKFAKTLEEVYGIKGVKSVDTLVAAQTRLSNSYKQLIDDLFATKKEGGLLVDSYNELADEVDDFGKSIINLKESINSLKLSMSSLIPENIRTSDSFKTISESIDIFREIVTTTANFIKFIKFLMDGLTFTITSLEPVLIGTTGAIKQLYENIKSLSASDVLNPVTALSKLFYNLSTAFKESIKGAEDYKKELEDTKAEQDKIKLIDLAIKRTNVLANATKKQIDVETLRNFLGSKSIEYLEKYNEQLLEQIKNLNTLGEGTGLQDRNLNSVISVGFEAREGSGTEVEAMVRMRDAIEKQIKSLKLLLKYTSKVSPEYEIIKQKIENLEKAFEGIEATQGMEDVLEWSKRFTKQQKEQAQASEESVERLKDYFSVFKEEFFSNAGFDFLGGILSDLEGFRALLKDNEDDWAVWATAVLETTQEVFDFLNQSQDAYFEKQLTRLEQEKEIAIEFAGDSTEAREEIERQYEARRKEILRRQAQAEKEMALFNIAIDTAQAIIGFLANPGFPQGVTLSAIAATIGAAQAAIVASTSIPEFFRGTMNAPEGWALVDEKRPEIHTDKYGNIKSFGQEKANYRWLSAGDKIYTSHEEYFNKELKGLLDVNGIDMPSKLIGDVSVNVSGGITKDDFRREIGKLTNVIMNKSTSVTNINKKGLETYVNTSQGKRRKHNNILTLKGGIV